MPSQYIKKTNFLPVKNRLLPYTVGAFKQGTCKTIGIYKNHGNFHQYKKENDYDYNNYCFVEKYNFLIAMLNI